MPVSPSPEAAPGRLVLDGVMLEHRDGAGAPLRLLDIPSLTVAAGSRLGVSGPSGCGKSSLLHLIAGLQLPTQGQVLWDGVAVSALSESRRDRWRRQVIGFVFQDFHLIPELDILGNVLLPAGFAGWGASAEDRDRALGLIARMGLPKARRRAGLLSRGEQQRVAIARALFRRPALILADEPTASLDAAHAAAVADLLLEAAAEIGATLICATHDPALLARFQRRLDLSRPAGQAVAA